MPLGYLAGDYSLAKMKKFFALLILTICTSLSAADRHIALMIRDDFRGEVSFAHRIQAACENIGWKADLVDIFNPIELHKYKYDFVINLVAGGLAPLKCKRYLAIFHPLHHFFRGGNLKNEYRSYDGYLLTYSPADFPNESKDFLNNKAFPYIRWYPTVHWIKYQTVEPTNLFHICCAGGDRFFNENFRKFFTLLNQESFVRLYGIPLFQSLYAKSYQGEIPFDSESICTIAADAGIALVIHSSEHNAYKVPSGRIFEAVAASAIVICDHNAFVQEHFGDSVLYFNTDTDGQSMYNQLMQHMEWIRNNKAEALKKAKQAHRIFKKKFLLEGQLLQLEKFHEKVPKK